ncbi:hypothetical protein C8J57DRAFT_1708401 [Mycena rebaudengoi]|nr:hypothetical protein C8J57DRAFT_1708401 [Mycena rebaudengoi]
MLLVLGNISLVDLAQFLIPTPATSLPRDLQILTRSSRRQIQSRDILETIEEGSGGSAEFSNRPMELADVARSDLTLFSAFLSNFNLLSQLPTRFSTPSYTPVLAATQIDYFDYKRQENIQLLPTINMPTLVVDEHVMPGATGVVFRATLGHLPLVIKAIPPGWKGADDLLNEAVMYETLASLQGIALPHSAGLFEGHGWLLIVLEDAGRPITVVSDLSLHQRRAFSNCTTEDRA